MPASLTNKIGFSYNYGLGENGWKTGYDENWIRADSLIVSTLGYNRATTFGLTYGYLGGYQYINGGITLVAPGTVALTNNTTNYVEWNPLTGLVTANTVGFTAGVRSPIALIVTLGGAISSVTDARILDLHKVQYPVIGGEVGVTDVTYKYGDVRRYGADVTGAVAADAAITNAQTSFSYVTIAGGTFLFAAAFSFTKALVIEPGGFIKPAAGIRVKILSGFSAIPVKCFDVSNAGANLNFELNRAIFDLYAQWWGAVGDGVVNDTVALQAAIDASIGTSNLYPNYSGRTLRLLPGNYKITTTLKVGDGSSYISANIIGAYGMYDGPASVLIDASSFLDRPGINIQGARGVHLFGFHIKGGNNAPVAMATAQTNTESDWITGGCTFGQYNVYSGITVDAYCGVAPGAPYPNDAYGRLPSSRVSLYGITVTNFVAGVAVKPSNDDNNCENFSFKELNLIYNTYGMSLGNSQARTIQASSIGIYGARWAVTCSKHGVQRGTLPHFITPNIGACWRLFDAASEFGQGSIENGHFEEFAEIIKTSNAATASASSIRFSGSLFTVGPYTRPPAAFKISMFPIIAGAPVVFDGCTFADNANLYGVLNILGAFQHSLVTFIGCSYIFYQGGWNDMPYIGYSSDADQCLPQHFGCKVATNEIAGSKHQTMLNSNRIDQQIGSTRVNFTPFSKSLDTALGGCYKFRTASDNTFVNMGYTSHVWNTATQVSITVADPNGFAINDILMWRTIVTDGVYQGIVPGLTVTNIVGSVLTCVCLFDPYCYDKTWVPTAVFLLPRDYVTAGVVTGDISSVTNTILNVVNATNIFKVRDTIKGAGIPANSRVTGVAGTTVTMSKVNLANTVGVTIGYGTKVLLI